MSRRDYVDPLPPNGLSARVAAGTRARFGYWPKDFLELVKRTQRGGEIPRHVHTLRERLERERPWNRCAHGVDLTVDFPFCSECMQ